MSVRLLKTTKASNGQVEEAKEVDFVYMDGTMTGMPELVGEPIEIRIFSQKLDCSALRVHTTGYSKRTLNRYLNDQLRVIGPSFFENMSSSQDLMDDLCFIWDSLRPVVLNQTQDPVITNGAPLKGHAQDSPTT